MDEKKIVADASLFDITLESGEKISRVNFGGASLEIINPEFAELIFENSCEEFFVRLEDSDFIIHKLFYPEDDEK